MASEDTKNDSGLCTITAEDPAVQQGSSLKAILLLAIFVHVIDRHMDKY